MLEMVRRKWIDLRCPGFSWSSHWRFFHAVLGPGRLRTIAMLGVYRGRDIAYMSAALRSAKVGDYHIVGVDRFEDRPGEDWPEDKRALGWEGAGYGAPPSLKATKRNLFKLGYLDNVTLIKGEAEAILDAGQRFDMVYVDICHDYESTALGIRLALQVVKPDGMVAGDDFSDHGTWGVASAVRDRFEHFQVFDDWIWFARPGDAKPQRSG
jgi:hypothetical protein